MPYTLDDWKSGVVPPKGWDVADCERDGWTREQVREFLKLALNPVAPVERPAPAPLPAKPVAQMRTVEQPQSAPVISIKTQKPLNDPNHWKSELVRDETGEKTKPNVSKNWLLHIMNDPEMRGVFAWDMFKMRVMVLRRPPWETDVENWEPRGLVDRDYTETVMWLESEPRFFTPKYSNIAPIVQAAAERNSYDALRDYLDGLEWDGVKRIDGFMTRYMGAADNDYSRTISRRFLISAVARGLKPGSKVDTMPIFEGAQGARKSTALRCLFSDEFFTDEISDIGTKDAMMEMGGVWGIEIAEMHRMSAAETNNVKKFLSRQVDRYRPPYGRQVIEAPRRVVMAGTINPEGNGYLKDPTGARRFWPILTGVIDIPAIERDRDQLWAEAVHEWKAGTPHWVQDDELRDVEAEQLSRTDTDVWTEIIADHVKTRNTATQTELLKVVGVPLKDVTQAHAARIGRVMRLLEFERRQKSIGRAITTEFVRMIPVVNEEEELPPQDW